MLSPIGCRFPNRRKENDMTERDRLIFMLIETFDEQYNARQMITSQHTADHLLANGVIVPPCKVGDMVYILDVFADDCKCADCDYYYEGGMGDLPECQKTIHGYRYHKCVEIIEQRATMQSILWWLSLDDCGKTVFLTREEAEKALEERSTPTC